MKPRNSNVNATRFYLAKSISLLQHKARGKLSRPGKHHGNPEMLEDNHEELDLNYLNKISQK